MNVTHADLIGAKDLIASAMNEALQKYDFGGMLGGYFAISANFWKANVETFSPEEVRGMLGLLAKGLALSGIKATFEYGVEGEETEEVG